MGRSVRLDTVTEDIRVRYDLPAFDDNSYPTTEQVTRMVNASLQSLYALLIEQQDDDYFTTYVEAQTQAGLSVTSLPSDVYRLKDVLWVRNGEEVVQLVHANVDQFAQSFRTPQAWESPSSYLPFAPTMRRPHYRLHGQAIRWMPVPAQVYQLRLVVTVLPKDLVNPGDVFDAGAGWQEWVVADVCLKIAEREDQDLTRWLNARALAEQSLQRQAPKRDENGIVQVRDVRRRDGGRGRRGGGIGWL